MVRLATIDACDDAGADADFVKQFLEAQFFSPHASDDPTTPLTITARFHKSIALTAFFPKVQR